MVKDVPPFKNRHTNKESEKENQKNAVDVESNGKPIPKTADLKSTPKVFVTLDSDRNILVPLLRIDSLPGDRNGASNRDPESPSYIMEASDTFLDPSLYRRYSICTDIDDTFPERLLTKMENIKDATRDKAVSSITAGENAVYWLVNTFKYLTSGWLGLMIILLTIFAYGSLGAFMFMVLESPNEEKYNTQLTVIRMELVNKIENILKNETIMMTKPDLITLVKGDLEAYENNYTKYMKHLNNNDPTENTWNFSNSFIFAGTIFTTIGYGHISPKTVSGRAATIVYAIIGIPLFLIALTSVGKFLTRIIKFFWMLIFRYKRPSVQVVKETPHLDVYRPSVIEDNFELISSQVEKKNTTKPEALSPPDIEIDEDFNLPISLALSILILYMLCGAGLAYSVENWTYFESFYCVFISMSTIGLGDFVISNSMYMIYSILYINLGLSLTAMCIDVVQKKFTVMFKSACEKFMELVDESDTSSNLNALAIE